MVGVGSTTELSSQPCTFYILSKCLSFLKHSLPRSSETLFFLVDMKVFTHSILFWHFQDSGCVQNIKFQDKELLKNMNEEGVSIVFFWCFCYTQSVDFILLSPHQKEALRKEDVNLHLSVYPLRSRGYPSVHLHTHKHVRHVTIHLDTQYCKDWLVIFPCTVSGWI